MRTTLSLLRATALWLASSSSGNNDCSMETTTTTSSPLAELLPPVEPNCRRRIYLLRHGETDWNERGLMQGGGFDIELNESGRAQATAVAKTLSSFNIGTIVSSHLKRASQTADIVQEQSFPKATRIELSEFGEMRFGSLEGMALRGPESTAETRDKFKVFNEKLQHDANLKWPGGGGESTAQVAARALKGLEQVLLQTTNDADEGDIAIVAHGRTNKVILASLLLHDMTRFAEITQWNTCINVIDLMVDDDAGDDSATNNIWESRIINYMGHVKHKAQE